MRERSVKERPILFSGSMVRALLDGRKTQTRRVIKPQPDDEFLEPMDWRHSTGGHSGPGWYFYCSEYPGEGSLFFYCPHGEIGDRLWVREAFAGGETFSTDVGVYREPIVYRASCNDGPEPTHWRPSIHMPRKASRITLEITDVRVQRVQEISEEDARAEGAGQAIAGQDERGPVKTYRTGFVYLWESINGKRPGCSWADSPWVWAISFKRVEQARGGGVADG